MSKKTLLLYEAGRSIEIPKGLPQNTVYCEVEEYAKRWQMSKIQITINRNDYSIKVIHGVPGYDDVGIQIGNSGVIDLCYLDDFIKDLQTVRDVFHKESET